MTTRDYVLIALGIAAVWYFSNADGSASSLSLNLTGAAAPGGGASQGGGATTAPRTGARPAPGQILTPQAADVSHPRDVVTTMTVPATGTTPASVVTASALHTPALGQIGWDTRAGRAVFFNGSNWDFGTYSGTFNPNAPDATADNAFIESGPGTTWYQKNPSLPTYP